MTSPTMGHGIRAADTPSMRLFRTTSFTAQNTERTGTVANTGRKPSKRRTSPRSALSSSAITCCRVFRVSKGCKRTALASSTPLPATRPLMATAAVDVCLRSTRRAPSFPPVMTQYSSSVSWSTSTWNRLSNAFTKGGGNLSSPAAIFSSTCTPSVVGSLGRIPSSKATAAAASVTTVRRLASFSACRTTPRRGTPRLRLLETRS
mmetsp:Transcript_35145/g.76757  ORF Transcript_35145/g.76757 Transcript_35145/m.76757 type:complete len:205 (+) Transcript_35145:705-1319(+)